MQHSVAVNTKLRCVDKYFYWQRAVATRAAPCYELIMSKEMTKQLVLKAGGPRSLAARIGTSRQAVAKWDRVPAHWVRLMEELTGVPAEQIRPDVFGRPTRRRAGNDRVAA